MPAPILDQLLERRLVILTGKGGAGKSTTSAALALVAARRKKKTLLIEVDAKGNLPDFFGAPHVGFRARQLYPGICGLSMQPRDAMREYLHLMLRVPGFSLKPLEGFIEYASGAIPGLKEILVMGKIYFEEKVTTRSGSPKWDLIIVDGAPTGHVVSQLGAARHLAGLVRSGPIHDQAEMIATLVADESRTALVLVTIPEEMPAQETIDLARRFKLDTAIRPAALIVNQVQPELIPGGRTEEFTDLVRGPARRTFKRRNPDGEPLLQAGEMYLEARARSEKLGRLVERSLKVPTLRVPYVFERSHGLQFTRSLADALEASQ